MRHSVYGKKLGRDKNQRTALFRSLVNALVLSESIETTQAKAAAVKGLVDKLINQAKNPDTRRLVSQFIINKQVSEKLINDLLPRLSDRTSGYTSVVKLGYRKGDGALVVQMRLLVKEKAEKPVKETKSAKKSADLANQIQLEDLPQEAPATKKAAKDKAPKLTAKKPAAKKATKKGAGK